MWERSALTGEMDATVRLADGGALGRRAARRVFVAAELDGAPAANPYTRLPFTAADEAAIFSARATRARPAPCRTYAAWRATAEGAAVAREMAAARAAGDAARAADADDAAAAWADGSDDSDDSDGSDDSFDDAVRALLAEEDGTLEGACARAWDAMEAHGVDALAGAPRAVRAHPDFVLAAIERFGGAALRHADAALRADAALARRAEAAEWTADHEPEWDGPDPHDEPEWDGPDPHDEAWYAMEERGVAALADAPLAVRADAEFVLAAMRRLDAAALRHAADGVRADAAFVRRAIGEVHGAVLPHAAEALRADPALVAASRAAARRGWDGPG